MCKVLLLILALFAPPLAVLFDRGCRRAFWLNCLLTLLFFIPGVIHAFMVILSKKHHHDHYDHHHHHHHHDEVVVVQPHTHYVAQPVVVGHGTQCQGVQQMVVGEGVVSYESRSVYRSAS
ncbi:hypothetical protein Aduo_011526 [Ancylostoma duodenale]